MAGTLKRLGEDILSPDELIDSLEAIRSSSGALDPNARPRLQTKEAIAQTKRAIHRGGDGNHRFEGERYLAIPNTHKEIRHFQLRKLVDEGGQDSVGGPMPSHPTLQRWHSEEFGLSEDEIDRLEMGDCAPDKLIGDGWWQWMHRTEAWPVLLGSALPGEGANRLPAVREQKLRTIDENRELYQQLGIQNVDRALTNQIEHSPIGADDDHALFGERMAREFIDTPELQEAMRKVFTLQLQHLRRTNV